MTLTIWTEAQLQWAVRNAVKHGDKDNTRLSAKISQVLRETEALYNLKPFTLPSDQEWFYSSLAIHQASLTTYTNLRAWVNTWRPAIIRSVKDARTKASQISSPSTSTILRSNETPFDDPLTQSS
jgi:hypothetical protein